MLHSTITLTMDTYWHSCPGQDAETVLLFPVIPSPYGLTSGLSGDSCRVLRFRLV